MAINYFISFMNIYSKVLRYINIKDVKQKHQQKLIEQKIKEETEKIEKEYIASVMKKKKYDWRKKLNEGMTSSGTFFTTLNPPQDTYDNPIVTSPTTTISYVNATNSSTRLITLGTFDISTIDQFEVNATRLGSGGSSYGWALQANGTVIAAGGENDPIRVATASQLALFKSGRVTLTIRQSTIPAFGDNATNPAVTGWTIENVKFYRTVPTNVFVSLDSPEASAFIRTDPFLSKLSPQERQQKLKEMLQASDEYVMKIFGGKFPGTGATPPGEYDPYEQAPPGEAGDTPGVDITDMSDLIAKDYIPPYVQDWEKLGGGGKTTNPNKGGGSDRWDPNDDRTWPSIKDQLKQASFSQNYQVAHYQPQGQLISERKKLKSPEELLNKIPGYYDGKPAPLGFPETPPPKMVNGYHPDLVDGKKVADRFNRLDPESAKAMPLTGNPHIDKKILKVRKQPK